jgi:hypothetical protein
MKAFQASPPEREKSLRGTRLKLFPSVVNLKVKEWKGPTPRKYDTETAAEV